MWSRVKWSRVNIREWSVMVVRWTPLWESGINVQNVKTMIYVRGVSRTTSMSSTSSSKWRSLCHKEISSLCRVCRCLKVTVHMLSTSNNNCNSSSVNNSSWKSHSSWIRYWKILLRTTSLLRRRKRITSKSKRRKRTTMLFRRRKRTTMLFSRRRRYLTSRSWLVSRQWNKQDYSTIVNRLSWKSLLTTNPKWNSRKWKPLLFSIRKKTRILPSCLWKTFLLAKKCILSLSTWKVNTLFFCLMLTQCTSTSLVNRKNSWLILFMFCLFSLPSTRRSLKSMKLFSVSSIMTISSTTRKRRFSSLLTITINYLRMKSSINL